jgi:hypothetical protein
VRSILVAQVSLCDILAASDSRGQPAVKNSSSHAASPLHKELQAISTTVVVVQHPDGGGSATSGVLEADAARHPCGRV